MRPVGSKCCILFQPHRYTRTRDHYLDFAKALDDSDIPFYFQSILLAKLPLKELQRSLIYDNLTNKERTILLTGDIERDVPIIKNTFYPEIILLALAGNVREWAEIFLDKIK